MAVKTLLIINPKAGQMQIKKHLSDLLEMFSANGMEVTVMYTAKKGDAESIAESNCENYGIVVCIGGDGTLNEVVNGIMKAENRPVMAYIPAGTTNDFAATLKIPLKTTEAGARIINALPVLMDVGSFQDRHFVYIASFGLLTEVPYMTPQENKNMLGHFAYFIEGVKQITNVKSYKLKIEIGKKLIEGEFIFGAVTNTKSIGGIIKFEENCIALDDGLLEVLLVKNPYDNFAMFQIMMEILSQKYDNPNVIFFQTNKIKISSESEIRWCLDGENGGIYKEAVISNKKHALEILL